MLRRGMARWLWLAAAIVLLDQLSKQLIEHMMHYGDSFPITPFFNLVLTYNPGAAFSFLADAGGWQKHFFTGLALVVSVVIINMLRKHHAETRFAWALSLILGGAIGNVIDRMIYGHVIDFIQLYYGRFYWPAFNVADSAICVGAALMVLDSFYSKPKYTR
ncbi:signal peptidase II [Chitinimonas sp. BJB300]|uniref:signal peptidase II n=1 Tax=Chitinimonas sp. BJB300 TaxID=1559339 RepID=UPI000C0DCF7E|nr:signal peptidase II [Chitinimonas sp. BJB300]PHV12445.1 signal peptidase II [Chitinimonas sp. BJB300]TSJ88569.1 lipoprotein signal peptidase [Chitinimonas sp. BJB300]